MNEHLSDLALDTLAAAPAAHPHLGACAPCRTRLESFVRVRERAVRDVRFEQIALALPDVRVRRLPIAPIGLALAAGLALAIVAVPRLGLAPQTRLKGGPELRLVALDGDGAPLRPGQHVALAVGAAGHGYALIVAQDARGNVSRIWPTDVGRSGPVGAGAAVRLQPGFEVTPGALHLVALFSDSPLTADDVLAAWRISGAPEPPPIAGEAARASTELAVEGAR